MKSIYGAFLLLLITACSAFAQGNLQFNRALKLDLNGPPAVSPGNNVEEAATITVTVPAGKVWKIESTNASVTKGTLTTTAAAGYSGPTTGLLIFLDDVAIYANDFFDQKLIPHQIQWLPAGTYTFSLWGMGYNAPPGWTYSATITGIEFNVIP